jgi:catechol 2,3-dioxygenase-like lactoylglutathione lyase family enzyme
MKIEHAAFPALDPVAVANWYVEHLGLRIVRSISAPTYTHFLADEDGSMIEIYNNPIVEVPDYASMHPLLLHVAFEVDDIHATRQRLLEAGCTAFDEITETPAGDTLAMMRDPWGFAIQLAKRSKAML